MKIGDMVVFALFGREAIGVFTGRKNKNIVFIDGGAGEIEIDRRNVIRVLEKSNIKIKGEQRKIYRR